MKKIAEKLGKIGTAIAACLPCLGRSYVVANVKHAQRMLGADVREMRSPPGYFIRFKNGICADVPCNYNGQGNRGMKIYRADGLKKIDDPALENLDFNMDARKVNPLDETFSILAGQPKIVRAQAEPDLSAMQ